MASNHEDCFSNIANKSLTQNGDTYTICQPETNHAKYICEECNASLSSDYNLRRHVSEVHEGKKYYAMRNPIAQYRWNFTCGKCNATLSSDYNLKRHVSEVHKGVKYNVKSKPSSQYNAVSSSMTLDDHSEYNEELHGSENKNICIKGERNEKEELSDNQGKTLSKNVLMKPVTKRTHKKNKHRTFKCEKCNASLSSDYNLRRHVSEIHEGVKYYSKRKPTTPTTLDDLSETSEVLRELENADICIKSDITEKEDLVENLSEKSEDLRELENTNICIKSELTEKEDLVDNLSDTSEELRELENTDTCIKGEIIEKEELVDNQGTALSKKVYQKAFTKNTQRTKRRIFTCIKCKSTLSSDYNLRRHISEIHEGVKYYASRKSSNQCGKVSTPKNLDKNKNICIKGERTEKEELFVNQGTMLSKKAYAKPLTENTQMKTNQKTFTCEKCDASLSSDYNLRRHVSEIHEGVKYYAKKKLATARHNSVELGTGRIVSQSQEYLEEDRNIFEILTQMNAANGLKAESAEQKKSSDSRDSKLTNRINRPFKIKAKRRRHKKCTCEVCCATFSSDNNLERHLSKIHKGVNNSQRKPTSQFISVSSPRLDSATLPSKGSELYDNGQVQNSQHGIDFRNEFCQAGKEGGNNYAKTKPVTCRYCGIIVKGKYSIERHLIEVHQGILVDLRRKQRFYAKNGIGKQNDVGVIKFAHVYPQAKLIKCHKCGFPFSSASSLRSHIIEMHRGYLDDRSDNTNLHCETKKENKNMRKLHKHMSCNKCDKWITKISDIRRHYRNAHLKEPTRQVWYRSCIKRARKHKVVGSFRCDTCNTTYKTASKLTNHMYDHIDMTCDNRGAIEREHPLKYSSDRQSTFHEKHMRVDLVNNVKVSGTKLFKCRFCHKTLSGVDKLRNHELLHAGNMPYRCFACGKSFLCQKYLMRHMKAHVLEHVPKIIYDCKPCCRQFSSLYQYQRHMDSSKHVPDHLICDICSKTFKRADSLTVHRKLHAQIEAGCVCNICGAEFKRSAYLDRHYLVHSGIKPFHCSLCSMTFKEKYQLKRHSMKHNPNRERVFRCNVCSKAFFTNNILQKHQRHVHKGERSYDCRICEKSFVSLGDLNRHLKTHSDERTEMCEICGNSFRLKAHLRAHLRMHRGEKLWGCEKCGVRYTDKRSYNHHIGRCTTILKS